MKNEGMFSNVAATAMFDRLQKGVLEEQKQSSSVVPMTKTLNPPNPAVGKLPTIHEEDRESMTESKSKEIPLPEVCLIDDNKHELPEVAEGKLQDADGHPEPDATQKPDPEKPPLLALKKCEDESKESPPPAQLSRPEGKEESEPELDIDEDPEIKETRQRSELEKNGFKSILVQSLVSYCKDILSANVMGELMNCDANELEATISKCPFVHNDAGFASLISAIRDVQSTAARFADEKPVQSSQSAAESKKEDPKLREMNESMSVLATALAEVQRNVQQRVKRLVGRRSVEEEKLADMIGELDTFSDEAPGLAMPLIKYVLRCYKSDDGKKRLDAYRYLTFAYNRKELEAVFTKNFYTQFDEKETYRLGFEKFSACINFVASKLNDKGLMSEMFSLMGVPMEAAALNLVNSGAMTGSEFDLSVYKKAFLQMREFRQKEELKDHVAFRRFLPYLYTFFLAFETNAVSRRKKFYKSFKRWIVQAFRETCMKEAAGRASEVLPIRTEVQATNGDNRPRTASVVSDSASPKGVTGPDGAFRNSFSYDEIVRALTLLQAQHPSSFGNVEFHLITENIQELLDVDPITFRSKNVVPLSSSSTQTDPLLVWEGNISHADFSLERYLALKLSELSMFQTLTKRKNPNSIDLVREERLFLYNEVHLIEKKRKLANYFSRVTASAADRLKDCEVDRFAVLLVDWVSKVYPGFDSIDALMVIYHFMKYNVTDSGSVPQRISKKDQLRICDNIMSLLDAAAYERLYYLYASVVAGFSLSSYSEIMQQIDHSSVRENKLAHARWEMARKASAKRAADAEEAGFMQAVLAKERKLPDKSRAVSPTSEAKNQSRKKVIEDLNRILLESMDDGRTREKKARKQQFEAEPTVFEGLDLKPKKKKAVTQKYVDMTGVKFCRSRENRAAMAASADSAKGKCTIV